MHRPQAARPDLTNFALKDDPHTALWRGIMAVQENKWNEAVGYFQSGEYAISEYPPAEQVASDLPHCGRPSRSMTSPPATSTTSSCRRSICRRGTRLNCRPLYGRVLDGLGRSIEALDVLETVLDSGDRKAEAEALYHYALLGHRLKKLDDDELQAKLETLAAIWRGDDLELNTLRRLAGLYVDREEYGNALKVMKVAVTNYPKAALSTRNSR